MNPEFEQLDRVIITMSTYFAVLALFRWDGVWVAIIAGALAWMYPALALAVGTGTLLVFLMGKFQGTSRATTIVDDAREDDRHDDEPDYIDAEFTVYPKISKRRK